MRLRRLDLRRYGHLSDEVLEFPGDRGLHIVLGANEAGKSTALEAVADGLFGFPGQSARDFLHPSSALRIGMTVRDPGGAELSFVRRKGNKDTLLSADAAAAPLPGQPLAPFLAGLSRERFEQVFALDSDRMRRGGEAILKEHGEAGAAILQARTGLRNLRGTVEALDEQARQLHGRGTRPRISVHRQTLLDQRRLLNERSLSGQAHEAALAAVAEAAGALAALDRQARALRTTQSRLARIRLTASDREAATRLDAELAALGDRPAVPVNAAAEREAALADRTAALRDIDDATADETRTAAALASLAPDAPVLAQAAAITTLSEQRAQIVAIHNDRAQQILQRTQHARDLDAVGAALDIPERGGALQARIPGTLARQAAERLLNQHTQSQGELLQAAKAASEAAAEHDGALAGLAALPDPADVSALRDAVEAARAEGRLESALDSARDDAADAAETARRALAGLALWTGTAEALAAARPPPEAEIKRLGAAIADRQRALDDATGRLARLEAEIEAARQDRARLSTALLPTGESLGQARARRDAVWRLLRRQLSGGAAPDAAELGAAGAGADGSPADVLDSRIREADGVADARFADAQRVSEWERLTALLAQQAKQRDASAQAVTAAQTALAGAKTAWRDAWRDAGVIPLAPDSMPLWLLERQTVLDADLAASRAGRAHATLAARHDARVAALRVAMPDAPDAGFAALLRRAERQLQAADAAGAERMGASRASDDAARRRVRARLNQERVAADLAKWTAGWAAHAGALGLRPGAAPDDATAALKLWAQADRLVQAWQAAEDRIAEMDEELRRHAGQLASLARDLGTVVDDAAIPGLVQRLADARQTQLEHARLAEELATTRTALDGHRKRRDHADSVLAALRAQLGVTNDAALDGAIARAALIDDRRAQLARHIAALIAGGDGKDRAALDQEAADEMDGAGPDAIPAKLAEIAARLEEQDAERTLRAGQHADAKRLVTEMEQHADTAGPANAMQDALEAMELDAARYVRLRLAHKLLESGIERVRRSQQGPLLRHAGHLFDAVTGGRYPRLEIDEDGKGRPFIAAVQASGPVCKADRLSEGTRDQLFLCLRLAAIATEAQGAEPAPFLADDLLVNFDDRRARATLELLATFGRETSQVILFTHHAHIAAMANPAHASLHSLPREPS